MNKLLIILLMLLLSCSKSKHNDLITKLDLNQTVISFLVENSIDNPEKAFAVSDDGSSIPLNGISFILSAEKAWDLVKRNQEILQQEGFYIFLGELIIENIKNDEWDHKYRVMIIKESDQFKVLKMMNVSAPNYDISNDDIISRLKSWNKRYGINVNGVYSDYVYIEFITVPKDIDSFLKEVYDFCPDAVDQNYGTMDNMKKDIKVNNSLALWWD
ncbi:MAG: DUF4253 domain-containing protein [Spirochaetes bacterium]|nr:DUF4253 domain-containing protein [Spirochaetota bacterium]